ncbi:MAG: hypothetical protein ACRD2N_26415 [Vicinamibacterales bacterium]
MDAPPVLLLVFNRVAVAGRLLDAVRLARPARLFIAADGPRPDHPEDQDLCRQARAVFGEIDWPCRVETRFQERNLGLKMAVISAVSWFFDHVEYGIILEDDCLPAPDFFPLAGELLERYASDPQIMHVSGLNMQPRDSFGPHSYFFAEVGHIWGWATWRRAWRLYDVTMADWPAMRHAFGLCAPPLRRALGRKFASAYAGRKATWSRIWYYTMFRHAGLATIPSVNFVQNIGFGPAATHTTGDWHPLRLEAFGRMRFPLDHPSDRTPSAAYHRHLARYHAGSYAQRVRELAWIAADRLVGR